MEGISYSFTHNIANLVSLLEVNLSYLFQPIMLSLDGITSLETKTMYVKSFRLDINQIDLIMPLIKVTLDNVKNYYDTINEELDPIQKLKNNI